MGYRHTRHIHQDDAINVLPVSQISVIFPVYIETGKKINCE